MRSLAATAQAGVVAGPSLYCREGVSRGIMTILLILACCGRTAAAGGGVCFGVLLVEYLLLDKNDI